MATNLEETLGRLLVPDNNTIQQATAELKELFKDPNIISGLCQILGSSQNPQVRQFAAVLLRRRITKAKQWRAIPEHLAKEIRENILQILLAEPEKSVRNSISQMVAIVAKHDIPGNKWPQLFDFINMYTKSQNVQERQIGMCLLFTVTSNAAEQLKPHIKSLLHLLTQGINDSESLQIPYYAIRTMSELVFYIGDEEAKFVQNMIPRTLEVVKQLLTQDEDQACEVLELFDELLECEVAILVPHLKTVIDFCLEISVSKDLDDAIRVKAMSFIASFIKLKKKAFMKHKLVDPVLHVVFSIMCSGGEEEEGDEEDLEEEVETQKPSVYAVQVLDTMALHIAPEKLVPNVLKIAEAEMISDQALHRRAAYLSLAVIVEGCADYIMSKHLKAILQCVVKGISDPEAQVRNAALFALGQFSEHLQPDISKYASDLLPLLFEYLGRASQEAEKNPKGLTKSYYALEMFCENLEKGILPYLPSLMEHLLNVLKTSTTNRPKELSISAIGATANAAKEAMTPYFAEIIQQFKEYLMAGDNEEMRKLQTQALDTLGVLARSVGVGVFQPLIKDCAELGLNLLQTVDDPDLRRCVYGLFAALSSIIKSDLSPYLENLITHMLGSLRSTEGVKTHFKDEEDQVNVFNAEDFGEEDISQEDDDEDNDDLNDNIVGISVENSFMDEKEDTCSALGEIASNTGVAFFPYLEGCFKEVMEMSSYPAPSIKKTASAALGQMCVSVYRAHKESPTPETEHALTQMVKTVMEKYLQLIKEETDRQAVMTVIDSLREMLQEIGQPLLDITGARDQILMRMKEVFTHKLACQDDDEEEGEDEQEAEYDGMLIESAGDVLPVMAKIMGGPNFMPFFCHFLTDLLKRLKQTSSVAEKSFAMGTIAEIVEACGDSIVQFTSTLYPLCIKMIKDEDDEVRSNSVFALGVLMANSNDKLFNQYSEVIKHLFGIMSRETNGRVADNVCAAACRMIKANKSGLPLPQVISMVAQCLPLKEDHDENDTIFGCILDLYNSGDQEVTKYTTQFLTAAAQTLEHDDVKPAARTIIMQFIQGAHSQFPSEFAAARTALGPDLAPKLDQYASQQMVNGNACH